jgi:hypothetical protein
VRDGVYLGISLQMLAIRGPVSIVKWGTAEAGSTAVRNVVAGVSALEARCCCSPFSSGRRDAASGGGGWPHGATAAAGEGGRRAGLFGRRVVVAGRRRRPANGGRRPAREGAIAGATEGAVEGAVDRARGTGVPRRAMWRRSGCMCFVLMSSVSIARPKLSSHTWF